MENFDTQKYVDEATENLVNRMDADTLVSFANKFISEQKPLDEDAARILEEHLWDCV